MKESSNQLIIKSTNYPIKKLLFLLIVFIAFCLRFWQLGQNPSSLDWDEASLGYNAYSILKTGADEYGTRFPLAIRSFGDYKPPLYTYLAIPGVFILGLTEFATRLPSAFFGFLTVVCIYFLVKELLDSGQSNSKRLQEILPFLVMFLLAISPWHIQFSRVAFESNIGLAFFIFGTWLFLKGIRKGLFLSFSAVSFALSLYAYHSPRLVAPIFVFGLAWWFRKELIVQKKAVATAFIIGIIFIAPLMSVFTGAGKARFQSVTVLTSQGTLNQSIGFINYDRMQGNPFGKIVHNRRVIYLLAVAKGYLDHFNLDFLFLTGDGPGRHHANEMGMLYLIEAPFILIGIILLIQEKQRWAMPLFWWFLVAPLASAITSGTPHAVRALLYLPAYQLFAGFGMIRMYEKIRKRIFIPLLFKSVIIGVVLLFSFNIYYYLHMYWVHTPIEHAREWQFGYKEMVKKVQEYQEGVDKIIVTYTYDQPYVYFLFYEPVDPSWYQKNWGVGEVLRANRAYGKYEFRDIEWEQDKNLKNTLLVGTPSEIPENVPGRIADIHFPDGSIAFRIIRL